MVSLDYHRPRRLAHVLRAAVLAVLIAFSARRGAAAGPVLTVAGPDRAVTYTLADLQLLPHETLTAFDAHEKSEHLYGGIPVRALLAAVGAPLGESLRGRALRMAVVVRARDGYATLYALAEFDAAFSDRTVLLVDSQDGKPLPENSGPLRIVAPGDKRPARWARMVASIEVVPLPEKSP